MANRLTRAFVSREQINNAVSQALGEILPGRVEQAYHVASSVQNFALGARIMVDERTFRYARAGAAIVNPPALHRLLVCYSTVLATNDRTPDLIHAIGSTVIKLPDTTAVADEYKNGWMEIWNAGSAGTFMLRRILGNTVSNGTYAWFTIDRGIGLAIAATGCQCTLHHNFYYDVGPAAVSAGYETPVGMAHVDGGVSLGQYFWLQTWGPAFVAATGAWPGSAANYRDVYFHSDGCINSAQGETVGTTSPPRVGYAVESGNYGVCLIMLQLAP